MTTHEQNLPKLYQNPGKFQQFANKSDANLSTEICSLQKKKAFKYKLLNLQNSQQQFHMLRFICQQVAADLPVLLSATYLVKLSKAIFKSKIYFFMVLVFKLSNSLHPQLEVSQTCVGTRKHIKILEI